jgi:hypothetical protein
MWKWPRSCTHILMCKFQAATTNPDERNTTAEHTRVSTGRTLPHLETALFLISSRDIDWKVSIVSCNLLFGR